MDLFNKALKFIDHERYKIFGLLTGIMVAVWMYGCTPTVTSPLSKESVTRQEWAVEVQDAEAALAQERANIEAAQVAYNSKVQLLATRGESVEKEFIKKEEFRKGFIDLAGGVAVTLASGGTVAWPGVVSSLVALLGVGLAAGGVVDSNRKNKIIAEEKAKNTVVKPG